MTTISLLHTSASAWLQFQGNERTPIYQKRELGRLIDEFRESLSRRPPTTERDISYSARLAEAQKFVVQPSPSDPSLLDQQDRIAFNLMAVSLHNYDGSILQKIHEKASATLGATNLYQGREMSPIAITAIHLLIGGFLLVQSRGELYQYTPALDQDTKSVLAARASVDALAQEFANKIASNYPDFEKEKWKNDISREINKVLEDPRFSQDPLKYIKVWDSERSPLEKLQGDGEKRNFSIPETMAQSFIHQLLGVQDRKDLPSYSSIAYQLNPASRARALRWEDA